MSYDICLCLTYFTWCVTLTYYDNRSIHVVANEIASFFPIAE